MTSLWSIVIDIFGTELGSYTVFVMFASTLLGCFIIYSLVNIIWSIFKWLGNI